MNVPTIEDLLVGQSRDAGSRMYGKYRGIVSDVDDPDGMGRIKAKVDALNGSETTWALPVVPFAGSGHGLVLIPEAGDGVWIEFEAGDTNRPLWTGGWWASGAMPPDGDIKKRALVCSNGHKLVLDEDGEIVQLKHAGGAEITLTASDITIKIGTAQIVLSASGVNVNNGALTVL